MAYLELVIKIISEKYIEMSSSNDEVKLIAVPKKVEEYLEREAYNRGIDVELLIVEKLLISTDPQTRKEVYTSNADLLLNEAFNYLNKGDLIQASEKGWGACASLWGKGGDGTL